MTAAVTVTPASGSITSHVTAVNVAVTGATANDATAYDVTKYPTEPAVTYYLSFHATGQPTLNSPVFSPAPSDGSAAWYGVIIPAATTWTLDLVKTSDSSVAATASVVVS